MRILINELKKIFNFKSIVVLLLINVVIYFLFIEFDISIFPNGRPQMDSYRISVKMINEKGNNLKDNDINYLYNMKEDMIKEADNYLKNNEKAKELNIKDYASFKEESSKQDKVSEEFDKLYSDIMFKEGVNVFWELEVIDNDIDHFKYKENEFKFLQGKTYEKRINEIRKNNSKNSILPWFVFENYNNIIINTSIAVIISIIFMIAPIFTRDKNIALELLQYTSKTGRELYKDKIKAAILATNILITIQLGILFLLFITRPYTVNIFYNSNINSCFSGNLFWFDITFLQYIILTIILLYIIGIIVTLITCIISVNISSYIQLIVALTPISVVLIYITQSLILDRVGFIYRFKYKLAIFKYRVPILILLLALTSIMLIVRRYKKEKNIDILI
ncbi:hypothetical protein [Clostridium weizhouense]|uniref:ABC-2 family transporter protein n=1 Tax=Clostridium weizhouense TaxID=2859781 RepID=A0ABS7AQ46_9CLOT|nr:hypothetical protein [Clostridium weizhouense]MBW6410792.1 hypothetical protein [Clostridium weizhouense]